MGNEVLQLEELVNHSDMMINLQPEETKILSKKCIRIKGNTFELKYQIQVKNNGNSTLIENQSRQNTDEEIQLEDDNQETNSKDKGYVPVLAYTGIESKDTVRFKDSHKFLPHERDVLNNVSKYGLKLFDVKENITINRDALFPSKIVKQCLGKEYEKVKIGDTIDAFEILYNMNKEFCDGILMPVDNCVTISTIAKYFGCNYGVIMGFFDHFWNKEAITLGCCGLDTFKIVYAKDESIMKDRVMVMECEAHDDFYIGLTLISMGKSFAEYRRDKAKYANQKESKYAQRKVKFKDEK